MQKHQRKHNSCINWFADKFDAKPSKLQHTTHKKTTDSIHNWNSAMHNLNKINSTVQAEQKLKQTLQYCYYTVQLHRRQLLWLQEETKRFFLRLPRKQHRINTLLGTTIIRLRTRNTPKISRKQNCLLFYKPTCRQADGSKWDIQMESDSRTLQL